MNEEKIQGNDRRGISIVSDEIATCKKVVWCWVSRVDKTCDRYIISHGKVEKYCTFASVDFHSQAVCPFPRFRSNSNIPGNQLVGYSP